MIDLNGRPVKTIVAVSFLYLLVCHACAQELSDGAVAVSYSDICDTQSLQELAFLQDRNAKNMARIRAFQCENFRLASLVKASPRSLGSSTNVTVQELAQLVEISRSLEDKLARSLDEMRRVYQKQYRYHLQLGRDAGVLSADKEAELMNRLREFFNQASLRVSSEGTTLRYPHSEEVKSRRHMQMRESLEDSGIPPGIVELAPSNTGSSIESPFPTSPLDRGHPLEAGSRDKKSPSSPPR